MSEWNLSVRLTGQGSGLARTLRSLSQDAKAASRNVNALRRDIDRLQASASNDIRIRLDLDAGNLRQDVSAALSTAGAGQGLSVDLRLGNAMQLRREVSDAVRWAAWGHRIEIPIGLADPMQLRRDVSAAVRWASMNQTITVRVNPDTSSLRTLTRGLNNGGSGGGGGDNKFNVSLKDFLLLAPAAIPLIAGLSTALGPLTTNLMAGGTAAAAFGIALAGQIEPLTEAADAETKYQEAVRDHGKSSKEAAEAQLAYQRILADLPPETQKASIALSSLKTTFGDWSDDMSGFTMQPVTKGFAVLDELIPRLTPHVKTASTQLDRLVTIAGGAISTPGFDAMADKFADFTDRQLDEMTDGVIHFLRVLSEGGAFKSGPIAEFMAYARENGPAAREALRAISDAVVTLLRGAAEAGPSMLTLVTAVAKLVAALPPEVVAVVLQLAAALKLASLAGAGAAATAAGVTRLTTAVRALGTTSAAAGGGIAGLRAAVASLSTGARFGAAAAGIGALVLAMHELSDNKPAVKVDELSTSLNTLISTGKVTGTLNANLDEMSASIAMVSKSASDNKLAQWTSDFGTWVGIAKGPGISTAKENIDAWDQSMANLVKSGNLKQAKDQYDLLVKLWKAAGGDMGELKEATTGYTNALADHKFEQELTAQSMGIFGRAAQDTTAKLNAQRTAADGLRASILALNDVNRSAYDAEIGFERSLDDLTAAFKENGNTLDIHTEKGRKNGEAMSAAAKSRDEMIASGLAAGESLGSMTKKSDELRSTMMRLATDAFDGNKKKAREYVNTLLGTPGEIKTMIKLEREEAIRGIQSVQAEIAKTPGAKSIRVDTLNAAAIKALEAVGLKTRQLPDGKTEVYTANGQAIGSIDAVARALANLDGKTANTWTTHTVTTHYRITGTPGSRVALSTSGGHQFEADGGVVDYYARGGIRAYAGGGTDPGDRPNQHVAQIAPAGSWRVWAESETEGEGYVPFRRSARHRSRAITEEIVRRLGGDPAGIAWHANGSVTDWRYDPQTGSLFTASDAGQRGNKTRKVKVKGKNGKVTIKEIEYFDLAAVEKRIKSTAKATQAWNKDLEKVADRVGGDVAEALASMGEEGRKLAHKMATGSTKYINDMAKALRNLQATAKASLTDYTRQLGNANKLNKAFSDNLARLAAQGYGDLAAQLAEQNDEAAQQLAAAAVKDKKKAASANAAAKTANTALTADQVSQLVQIIAAISTSKIGIHDVAGKTGLGEDEIIAVANKAKSQIQSSLGSRATKFLADLTAANKGMAYANGGIRAGMYATQAGIVRFAEPSTGGEAYIPLGLNKRSRALPVLADVARRFGLGTQDAQQRVIIVRESGPLVGHQTWHVTTNGGARETARRIDADNAYQLRRLARGGVGAR